MKSNETMYRQLFNRCEGRLLMETICVDEIKMMNWRSKAITKKKLQRTIHKHEQCL